MGKWLEIIYTYIHTYIYICNTYTYIYVYIYIHIKIYTYVFLKLLESKKWGKLPSFGVDMCFLKLLESKQWWKLTSFGVDGLKLTPTLPKYSKAMTSVLSCSQPPLKVSRFYLLGKIGKLRGILSFSPTIQLKFYRKITAKAPLKSNYKHENLLSLSDPQPDQLFWHSFWHTIWKSSFWHMLWHLFWHSIGIYSDIPFGINSGILSGILSGISSHILSGILSGISSESLCGWGPAGNTLIRSSRLRSGREHFDPELAVEVRRGTPWSGACGGGLAGNALILLLFGSGGDHRDHELAVEVRRVALLYPGLAVRVRQGTRRSSACSWGPAEEEAQEQEAGGGRDSWHKI